MTHNLPAPPRVTELLLAAVTPRNRWGESIVGDLREEFLHRVALSGPRGAAWWYRAEAWRLIVRYGIRAVARFPGAARVGTAFSHTSRRVEHVNNVLRDIRYAVRTLVARPVLAGTVIVTLAIGIGANAAIFSVVNGVLLHPLPYPQADRLIGVWGRFVPESGFNFRRIALAPPEYIDYRNANQTMESVAAYAFLAATVVDGDGEAERVSGSAVTANLFPMLRAAAHVGRTITDADDRPSADLVVVLGHALWQRRWGGDPGIVGRSISLNGTMVEVVGVMPPGFAFPNENAQMYMALQLDEAQRDNRQNHYVNAVGRLRDGVTLERVESELQTMMAQWKADFPDIHTGHFLWVEPMLETVVGGIRPALLVLMGAVTFVLVLVCANVANLLLAAGESRRREIAVRCALGAGRGRVVQQLLTESLVLAAVGGGLGLLTAHLGTSLMLDLSGGGIPRADQVGLDGRVLAFTVAVTLATSVLFGLVPAAQSARSDVQSAFKDGARTNTAGRGPMLLRKALVVAEIALSILLVVGAGLMVRSFGALRDEDPGFDPERVLVASLSLPGGDYSAERSTLFYTDLLAQVEAIPGVTRVGGVTALPFIHGRPPADFEIQGYGSNMRGEFRLNAADASARPGYFETMGIRVVRGRVFEPSDREGAPTVAVINESMARRFWPDGDPIGQSIRFASCGECDWARIVGIVEDVKHTNLQTDAVPLYYFAAAQAATTGGFAARSLTLTIKTSGDPLTIAPELRALIRRLDAQLPILTLQRMSDIVASSLAAPRFTMLLMGVFGAVALVLGAVGVYGVMAYHVAHRTPEIGVRIALGAGWGEVSRMILGQGLQLALLGVGIGVMAALWATQLMTDLLFNVSATDPMTFVGVSALLTGVAALAAYLPARRATQVDPMTAMRP